jgi:hypothetical protein
VVVLNIVLSAAALARDKLYRSESRPEVVLSAGRHCRQALKSPYDRTTKVRHQWSMRSEALHDKSNLKIRFLHPDFEEVVCCKFTSVSHCSEV